MNSRLKTALSTIVFMTLMFSAIGICAAEERTPLSVRDYDEVVLAGRNDSVVGTILQDDNDGVRIVQDGHSDKGVWYPRTQIAKIEYRQTAEQAVQRRGAEALAANDFTDLLRTMKWGVEKSVKDAALDLGQKALARKGSTDIAALVMTLLWEKDDAAGVATAAKQGMALDPRWPLGYLNLAKALEKLGQAEELKKLVQAWLDVMPTSPDANRYAATAAEIAGDVPAALAAYRKLWELHHDAAAGLAYARLSLRRGGSERVVALKTAQALIDAQQNVAAAQIIAGSALVAGGDPALDAQAQPLLEAGLAAAAGADSGVSDELKIWAEYNLGLIAFRAGRFDVARKAWADLKHPAAIVASGILDRRPVPVAEVPDALRALAADLDASLDLEAKRHREAAATLADAKLPPKRQQFLTQIAAMLAKPSDETLKALSLWDTDEARRWQAYGCLISNRLAQVDAILAKLPSDDGYAAVARVYLAAAQKDDAKARELFLTVSGSKNPPADYVARLTAEYAAANNEHVTENFDWPEGDQLATGWQSSTPGTGIHVHAVDGKLLLEGTQAASDESVSRVWYTVPADRVRAAEISLDLSAIAEATAGFELLDEAQANGVALAVQPDNRIAWRALKVGVWGDWQPLSVLQGRQVTMKVEYDRGRVFVLTTDDPAQRIATGVDLGNKTQVVNVGEFGAAKPGVAWKLAADDFKVQLKPIASR